ncbi:MAG: 7-carboxy-7-deazaguanine synthase [Alphaproteobacteria bacterium]|nr:7-carboxy-7-deazaguanine synthase [Alphaproteobacteria bacterium]MCZ6847268.1 7-carboxy-7-deazaguanine synthase [Alphaproteobacteria bacterium]
MTYAVKELYVTLQGEGANTGRAAVFCRFAGCNLWSGREADRAEAQCGFCDTEFIGTDGPGGGAFKSAAALAAAARTLWTADRESGDGPFIVCTGGEPLLQLDGALIDAFHGEGFVIAVETNGTLAPPPGLDWICVSPKAGTSLVLRAGDELKLVYPQAGAPPEAFAGLDFDHFFLQPMDGPERDPNTRKAIDYCLSHPGWRLSLQTHKYLGLP